RDVAGSQTLALPHRPSHPCALFASPGDGKPAHPHFRRECEELSPVPPEGLVRPGQAGFTSDPVNVVHQATKITGETLSDLFRQYGSVATRLLWLPCRAVFGHEGSLVDAGDFPNGQEVIGCTLEEREPDYYQQPRPADDNYRTRGARQRSASLAADRS